MEEYYYLSPDNQRMGPFSLEVLLTKNINSNTLIWKNGLAQWTPAANVAEVAQRLPHQSQTATPPPVQPIYNNGNRPPCPPTNLIWGVLATLFCCLPLGVVSIIMASKVERYYYNGDYEGAKKASKSAANWCIASLVVAVIGWAIYLGFIFMIAPIALMEV